MSAQLTDTKRDRRIARARAAVTVAMTVLTLQPALAARAAAAADATDWPALEIAGQTVAPGQTARMFVNVSGVATGASRMLDTLLVVTRGVRPGPTLCLVGGIHGDELNGVEIARRVYAATPGDSLSGTLLAVPGANIQGLRTGDRYLPDRRDLNRAFPGNPNGSLASRIAHSLYAGVIDRCDALIDLHTGSASRTNLPQIRTDLDSPEALALARSFGVGIILSGRGPKGSLRREVLDGGVPAVIYEAGGPLEFEEQEIVEGVRGVRNVMAGLGMIEYKPKREKLEVYRKTSWVRSGDAQGIFLTQRKAGERVRKGDLLGTVVDAITDTTNEIRSPRDGRIIGLAVPQMVLPGYGLFHIGYDPE